MPHGYGVQVHIATGAGPHSYRTFYTEKQDPKETLDLVRKLQDEGAVLGDDDPWGYHVLVSHATGRQHETKWGGDYSPGYTTGHMPNRAADPNSQIHTVPHGGPNLPENTAPRSRQMSRRLLKSRSLS